MAERLDVTERLAEGRASVEHTQAYVRACHALGYDHPDLTAHPSQVLDFYDSEDGLDLRTLDRDCGELRAAGAALTEALRIQRAQVVELAAAWTGRGGDAAVRLLERHCDDGAAVVAELRAAAQRCESLRDNLWYLVDSKVATAIAVDERTRGQRQEWLAAAAIVTTGAGNRSGAEEVVRQHITPYVDQDIRHDWLTTMRSTTDGAATSYDMVIDRMAAACAPTFDHPGDLLPFAGPPPSPGPAVGPALSPAPAAAAVPAASPGPPDGPGPLVAPAAEAPVAAGPAPPGWGGALGDASGLPGIGAGGLGGGSGGLGGGSGGLGGLGGLAGLAARIVDALGEALSPLAAGTDGDVRAGGDPLDEDPVDGDDPFHPEDGDEPFHPDEAGDGPPEVDELKEADPVDHALSVDPPPPAEPPDAPADVAPPTAPPGPVEPPGSPVAAGPPAPSVPPAGSAPPAADGSTPCQIAADQLPQAGQ